jgi:acetoin utilization deacetylase AcuC-like enzyme
MAPLPFGRDRESARVRVFFPDTLDIPLPPGHRFPAQKYALLRQAILDRGIFSADELQPSPMATEAQLLRAHDSVYVSGMLSGTASAETMARIGLPWSAILVARSRATVGGTLQAARCALVDGVCGQLAGGTHHAHRDAGSGFCVFNDCAVAALTLLDERKVACVAILDLDVHQGDGNATIFAGERRVFTASVHGEKNYPFEKAASNLDIALPDGTGDDAYVVACQQALAAVISFAPDLVFYIAGADPLASDRLGRLRVSHDGLTQRDTLVLSTCQDRRIPVVILIGGGYADPITDTVTAYANTFQVARNVFG